MPIQVQSVGTLVFGSGTSIATAAPSGVAIGDLLVLCVSTQHDTAGGAPTGWTLGANAAPSSGAIQSVVFWRIADGTADDTPTVSLSLSDGYAAVILRITGNDATTPFDVAATYSQSSGSSISVPAVTTSTASSLLIALASLPTNLFSGSPSGWTTEHSSSVFTAIRIWSQQVSTGPATFGPDTVGLFTSSSAAVVTLAFAPVAVGAGIYPPSIAPTNNFGTGLLGQEIDLSALAPDNHFGTPTVLPDGEVLLSGLAPTNNFGTAQLHENWVILEAGFATLNIFGQARLWREGDISLEGLAPSNNFGTAIAQEAPDHNIRPASMPPQNRFGNATAVLPGHDYQALFLTGRTRRITMSGSYSYDFTVNMANGGALRYGSVQAGFDYQHVVNGVQFASGPTIRAESRSLFRPTPGHPLQTQHRIINAGGEVVYQNDDFHGTPELIERDFPDSGTFEISGLFAEYFRISSDGSRIYAETLVPGSDYTIRVGANDTSFRVTRWMGGEVFPAYFPYISADATGQFYKSPTVAKNYTGHTSFSWQVTYGPAETLGMVAVSASSPIASAGAGSCTGTGDYSFVAEFGNGSYGIGGYYCAILPKITTHLTGRLYDFGGVVGESVTFKNAVNSANARSSPPHYAVTFSGTGEATNTQVWDWHSARAFARRGAPGDPALGRLEDDHYDFTHRFNAGITPVEVVSAWVDAELASGHVNTASPGLNPVRTDETLLRPLRGYAKQVSAASVHKNQYRYVAKDPWAPINVLFGRGWFKLGPTTTLSIVSGKLRIAAGVRTAIGFGFPGYYNMGAYLSEGYRTENRHVRVRIRSVGSANKRFRLICDNIAGGDPNGIALSWTDATGADGVWVERVFDKYQATYSPLNFTEGPSVPVTYPAFTSIPPLDNILRTTIDYLEQNTTYEVEFIRWEREAATSDATATVENGAVYGQSETVPSDVLAMPADPLLTGQNDGSWEVNSLLPLTPNKPYIPTMDNNGGLVLMVPEDWLYESDLFEQFHFNNAGTDSYPYLLYGGGTGRSRHGSQIDVNVADPAGATVWGAMPVKGVTFYPGAGDVLNPASSYSTVTNIEVSACVWRGHYGGVLNGEGQEVVHIENGPPETERSRVSVGSNEFFRTDGSYGPFNVPQSLYVDDADTVRRAAASGGEEGRFYWHLWRANAAAWLSADLSDTLRAGRAWVQNGTIRLAFAQFPDGTGWSSVNTGITGFEPCLRYQRGGRAGAWILTYRDNTGNILRRATLDEGASFDGPLTVFSGVYKYPCFVVTPTGMESHFAIRTSDSLIRGTVLDPQGGVQISEFTAVSGVSADAISAFAWAGTIYLLYRDGSGIHRVKSDDLTTFTSPISLFGTGYKFVGCGISPTGMEHHFARRDSDGAIRGVVLDAQGNTAIAEFTAVSGSVDSDAIASYERFGRVFLLYRNAGAIQTVKSDNLTTFA